MQAEIIPFEQVGNLSEITNAYIHQHPSLKPFVADFFTPEGITNAITHRQFDAGKRKVLVDALKKQYQRAGMRVPKNLELLALENTFTVTTGHQLCLFGGPKYFIYKIVSAIKTARNWSKLFPDKNVVPVFWLASEDHDFEEINAVQLFRKKIQTNQPAKGPVGRLKPTLFDEALNELKEIFKNDEKAQQLVAIFEAAMSRSTWADATRYWVQQLFGEELLIVDGDDEELKRMALPVFQKELAEKVAEKRITETSVMLSEKAFHAQIHPRPVNLFYIEEGLREYIVPIENGQYQIKNTDRKYTEQSLLEHMTKHPETISPNVALRPVYQECILPNLAYVGGPGELAYWFQLKTTFEEFKIPFPLLILRDSFMVVPGRDKEQLIQMKLALTDLFLTEEEIIKTYLGNTITDAVKWSREEEELNRWQQQIMERAKTLDKDMEKMLLAEFAQWNKLFEKLENKLLKNEKQREEVAINRLKKLKQTYHPNQVLNERIDSFIGEFLSIDNYIAVLLEYSLPEQYGIKVLTI
jgi:bacillithiol synthase